MSTIIVGPVRSFSSEETPLHFEFDSGKALSTDNRFLEENFINQRFLSCIGIIEANSFFGTPYVYSEIDFDENENITRSDLEDILEVIWGPFQAFLLSLWFVKDNNVNIDALYLYDSQSELVSRNRRNLWFSNASGKYEQTHFTREELQTALEWKAKFVKYLEADEIIKPESHISGEVNFRNASAQTPYANMNRFSRALRFILVGRSESFLPMKISAYVGALESLFSTSKGEIAHQVSERAVKLLGGNIETRLKNYTLIKKVYEIRSTYVHGSEIKDATLGKATDLIKDFDGLIRKIMKVLIEEHPELSEMKQNELDIWFKKLILE